MQQTAEVIRRWTLAKVGMWAVLCGIAAALLIAWTTFDNRWTTKFSVATGTALSEPVAAASPDGNDITPSFHMAAEVFADHSVRITEDIVQTFATPHHGIERSIPLRNHGRNTAMRSLEVSASPGASSATDITDAGDGITIRIGDSKVTIVGTFAYRLTYVLENVVTMQGDQVEVALNSPGDWVQPIVAFTYEVVGPSRAISVNCVSGPFGSANPCTRTTPTPTGGRFRQTTGSAGADPVTVSVVYSAGTFAAAATVTPLHGPIGLAWGMGGAIIAAVGAAYAISVRRSQASVRRADGFAFDTFSAPHQADLPGRTARGGLQPNRDAVVEFVPPMNLDPASMLRIRDAGEADVGVLMAATLVDLAADGVIDLKQNADGSWTVHRVDHAPRAVTDYEMTMLTALLGYETNECVLESRTAELGKVLPTFVRQVDEHLHQLGLFTPGKKGFGTSRGATIGKWVLGGVAVLAAVAIGYGGVGELSQTAGVLVAAGLVIAGVVLAAVLYDRRRVKAYTPLGSGAARRAAGFERFFRDSEAAHAQAAQRMGLFREYMGYAVAFGAVDEWVAAMPTGADTVMVGGVPAAAMRNLAMMHMWGNVRTQAFANEAAVARAASGFSGSSSVSSGGFSGGGFGGGGGGSW